MTKTDTYFTDILKLAFWVLVIVGNLLLISQLLLPHSGGKPLDTEHSEGVSLSEVALSQTAVAPAIGEDEEIWAEVSAYTIYDEGVNCVSASGDYLCSTPEMRAGARDAGVQCIMGNCDGTWMVGYSDRDGMMYAMVATSTQEKYPKRYYLACPKRYNFGTIFKIGERYFECIDRMAPSYRVGNYFDLWFGDNLEEAKSFGRQQLKIKVISQP